MKFPVIEISKEKITAKERQTEETFYHDVNVNAASDYISHAATFQERKEFIRERLPEILEGIATVNSKNDTITVRPAEEVRKAIHDDLRKKLNSWGRKLQKGTLSYDDPRFEGEQYRGTSAMFTLNGTHAMFSGPFVESLACYGGQTLHIGGVVFAHR